MKKVFVLYNPKSGNGTGEKEGKKLSNYENYEVSFHDITKIENYKEFFAMLHSDDIAVIAGGDGTLSRFVDDIASIDITNDIYYYATGSGNDFLKDVNHVKGEKPFLLNAYIKGLPVMSFGDIKTRFVNGVGGGLDAYSCAEGSKLHARGKKVNYVATAIKGILGGYDPVNANITVDGEDYRFTNVWFASVMKGRYFGGGIMLAPKQNRNTGKVTLVVVHTVGRIGIFPIIPQAFFGKHVRYKKYVTVIEGDNISVTFDRPVPVQIDGETEDGITNYSVKSHAEKTVSLEK